MKRFFDKIDKTDSCWNWTAASRSSGYGCMKFNGKLTDAHRISWVLHFGDIPKDMYVCHACDNRKCVNPEHLFLGTQSVNMKDAYLKGRISMPHFDSTGIRSSNRRIKNEDEIIAVKNAIKNRKTTLRQLSIFLELPYQLIRDISSGRVYK